MEQSPVTIYADAREAAGPTLQRLQMLGAQLRVGELEIGDYVVGGEAVIVRKAATQFIASLVEGRLSNLTGKLILSFPKVIYLVEGDLYSTRTPIAREAIDGALASLACLPGVSVLYMRNPSASADLIYRIARTVQAANGGAESAFRKGKIPAGRAAAQFVLEGVVGVGPSTAAKALDHFGSVHAFMIATVDQLLEVPGIGRVKAERIHECLHWKASHSDPAVPSMFVDQTAG